MIAAAQESLDLLLAGNERFRAGRPQNHAYTPEQLQELSRSQKPKAAIIACADSRVSPEIIFDQPLGTIFASRVPGNVASDSAKWMLDIAVQEFKVPLVMVLAHTGCLAVGQLLEGDRGGAGGSLRYEVLNAILEVKMKNPADLYREALIHNARQTVTNLLRYSFPVKQAIQEHGIELIAALYHMETGEVELV